MSWSFCSKGGGVFLWRVIGLFYQWQGIFLQGYWNFFFNGSGFLE